MLILLGPTGKAGLMIVRHPFARGLFRYLGFGAMVGNRVIYYIVADYPRLQFEQS